MRISSSAHGATRHVNASYRSQRRKAAGCFHSARPWRCRTFLIATLSASSTRLSFSVSIKPVDIYVRCLRVSVATVRGRVPLFLTDTRLILTRPFPSWFELSKSVVQIAWFRKIDLRKSCKHCNFTYSSSVFLSSWVGLRKSTSFCIGNLQKLLFEIFFLYVPDLLDKEWFLTSSGLGLISKWRKRRDDTVFWFWEEVATITYLKYPFSSFLTYVT